MDKIQKVKENFLVIQLEQLLTIKKELLHTKRICNYFSVERSTPYANIYAYNLERVEIFFNDIENIRKSAIENQTIIKVYQFLVEVARRQKEITLVLDGLRLLKSSIRQHGEESFNQYIPKADLGRRYSSKTISTFIRRQMSEVLNSCDDDKNIKALIVWTFRNEFQSKETINPRAIETPHYYYDLPYFIPNIFHELNHIGFTLDNPSEEFKPYKLLSEKLKEDILKLSSSKKNLGAGLEINPDFPEEFISDLFAYDLLGEGYLFSCFYSIIYSGMDNLFLENKDSVQYDLPDFYINKNKDKDKMDNLSHVVEIHLRMQLLIKYALVRKNRTEDTVLKENLKSMKIFIDNIFFRTNNLYSLSESYQKKSDHGTLNDKDFFEHFKSLIDSLEFSVETFSAHFKDHNKLIIDSNIDYEKIFTDIWKEKLENTNIIFHRNSLREGILRQIFSHEKYKDFKYKPYELTFFKFRDPINIKENIDSYFIEHTGYGLKPEPRTIDYEQYHSYGIYNNIAIREKSKEVRRNVVEDFLVNNKQENVNFYTYKIAMVKLFENQNLLPSNPISNFGLILQIQLNNQEENTILEGYESISRIMEESKGLCSYEIYKILGPNDYLIKIKHASLNTIFDFKKYFSKDNQDIFRRTFSTIFIIDKKEIINNTENNFVKVTKIRLKGNIDIDNLQNIPIVERKILKDYYDTIFYTTGAMDIEIQWKLNTNIDKIIEKIYPFISDIQTNYKQNIG